ncbi:MAG: response regulator transcription factor [Terracidiphilus sp.]|jgi:DNA-binding NarL/FixJ family response regulator
MNTQTQIRVFCVDDHPITREGISAVIRNEADMLLVAEASNGREAIEAYRVHRPDVTLMDLKLPDISGIDAMIAIRTEFSDARVIILTTFEGDAEIQRALNAGAQGYLLKSLSRRQLLDVIRNVHCGRKQIPADVAIHLAEHMGKEPLTKREVDVLEKIAEGKRNSEIATLLFISEETVKGHIKHILGKLDASDRTEAVAIGIRRGIIHL